MLKLDNAAKIYPAAMTKKWNAVYRVSVYMKEEINVPVLKTAVCDLAKRFPAFYSQLYKGFFWDYLQGVENYDIVRKETDFPCRPLAIGNYDKPMFRVLYRDNRISVEFFHGVTDGHGSSVFLKTLIARYLEIQGFEIEKQFGVLDIDQAPLDTELHDDYQNLYNKSLKLSRKENDAYQFLPPKKENYLNVTSGNIPIDKLKQVINLKYHCTINEYLTSVYALSFMQQYFKDSNTKETKKKIKISIPVNLRPYFGSQTLRNFASFINVEIDPTSCKELPQIIACIKEQCEKLITKENLEKGVSTNVSEEKMLIAKIAPNALKKPIMKIGFHLFGERKYTSVFSNSGLLRVPPAMEPHIESFEYALGETCLNRICAVAIGYKNNLTVTLSSSTENTEVQDFFFKKIQDDGIAFEIKTNTIAA